MFLEKINKKKLVEFAEKEFGKVTMLRKLRMKKTGDIVYNMSFRLKPNGTYEEAYFYDDEVFPLRVEGLEDRVIENINERFTKFVENNLPNKYKVEYANLVRKKELDRQIKNQNV